MKYLVTLLLACSSVAACFAQKEDDLIKACLKGDLPTVKSLVESGVNVNYKNAQGNTPISCSWLWPEQAQFLINKGADVNSGTFPALVQAAKYSSKDVMRILLKAGADPNKPGTVDVAAGMRAALEAEKAKGDKANPKIIEIFEKKIKEMGGGDAPAKIYPLMNAVATNCTECIKMLLDAGARTDIVNDITGNNLLHELAANYKTADKRVHDMNYNKPYLEKAGVIFPDWYVNLDYSKLGNADEIVTMLVSKGVDIQAKNKLGHSPLYAAFDKDSAVNSEVVLALVNHGADINTDEGKSRTESPAIIEAAAYCTPDVLDAILNHGGKINVEDRLYDASIKTYAAGFTALINAARHNNFPAVRYLVSKGAKITDGVHGYSALVALGCLTKVKHKSVLYYAIETGNIDMVKYLVDSADIWGYKGEPMTVDPLERKEVQDFGSFTITKTSCIGYETYPPAKYAKALDMDEIYAYLKPKRLY